MVARLLGRVGGGPYITTSIHFPRLPHGDVALLVTPCFRNDDLTWVMPCHVACVAEVTLQRRGLVHIDECDQRLHSSTKACHYSNHDAS